MSPNAIPQRLLPTQPLKSIERELSVSDYSYDRAILFGLVGRLSQMEKKEFKREVQNQLGLAAGQDCDTIC